MIPKNEDIYVDEKIEIVKQPSFTHKMDIDKERVYDYVEGVDAYRQYVYKCINTEKNLYPIYPNFGVMKRDLFGKPKDLAYIKLTRRIEDALMLDDRTIKVYGFEYVRDWSKDDNLGMKFKVMTIYGVVNIEEVVNLE